jgi:hypothetical protein
MILSSRIPTTRMLSPILTSWTMILKRNPKTILNLLSLKIRLWRQSQRSSQNPMRMTILMIRIPTNRTCRTTNQNLRSLTRNSIRTIPTKSLNWRSRRKHSSRPGRRRPIAIRSLKVPPKRSVSIEPSKVAVQSDSFVGRFVSCLRALFRFIVSGWQAGDYCTAGQS